MALEMLQLMLFACLYNEPHSCFGSLRRSRSVATNSGLGEVGGQVQIETFFYCKYGRDIRESNTSSSC